MLGRSSSLAPTFSGSASGDPSIPAPVGVRSPQPRRLTYSSWRITTHSSRRRFAARLSSGVRLHGNIYVSFKTAHAASKADSVLPGWLDVQSGFLQFKDRIGAVHSNFPQVKTIGSSLQIGRMPGPALLRIPLQIMRLQRKLWRWGTTAAATGYSLTSRSS